MLFGSRHHEHIMPFIILSLVTSSRNNMFKIKGIISLEYFLHGRIGLNLCEDARGEKNPRITQRLQSEDKIHLLVSGQE